MYHGKNSLVLSGHLLLPESSRLNKNSNLEMNSKVHRSMIWSFFKWMVSFYCPLKLQCWQQTYHTLIIKHWNKIRASNKKDLKVCKIDDTHTQIRTFSKVKHVFLVKSKHSSKKDSFHHLKQCLKKFFVNGRKKLKIVISRWF